jgi:hypothetical protein
VRRAGQNVPWRQFVCLAVHLLAALGLAVLLLVLLLAFGCAGQVGPVAWAFGQSSVCRGPAESYYSAATGTLEAESCQGGYVTGGPVSEPAGRAMGVVGRGLIRAGSALGGAPAGPAGLRDGPGCPDDCP